MKLFPVQFQDHHSVHWQSVWAISSWWKWVEPKAHRGQQGALLLLLYISIWTWVSVETLLLSWNCISIFDQHLFVPADSGKDFVNVNSKIHCWLRLETKLQQQKNNFFISPQTVPNTLPTLTFSFLSVMFFLFSLKPLDVEFMKAIHSKVNIVPVIAKADTLTLRERDRLKRRVSVIQTVQCCFLTFNVFCPPWWHLINSYSYEKIII